MCYDVKHRIFKQVNEKCQNKGCDTVIQKASMDTTVIIVLGLIGEKNGKQQY